MSSDGGLGLERQLRLNEALAGLASSLIAEPIAIVELARNVLAHARKLTGAEHGFVSEIDPVSGDNVGHTLTDMMPNCSVGEPDKRIAFPQGDDGSYGGLWGLALNTGHGFFTNSPSEHEAGVGLPEGHVRLERFLAVPAVVGGRVLGEIALANPPEPFSEEDLDAVEQLARLYALAIERNRTDLALRESEARYRHLVETMSDGMGSIDAAGRITFVNRRLEKMLGYERGELVGLHFAELFDGENLEKVKSGFATRKADVSAPYELTWKRKDGSALSTIMSPQPLLGDEGELIGSIAVVTDISALKRAEERDQEHAETMAFLAETAMGFVELPPERDIYDFVVEKLQEAIGPAIIVACSFDDATSKFTVQSLSGFGEKTARVVELLGMEVVGMSFGVGPELLRMFRAGRLVKLEGGLYESANRQLPKLASAAIEKLLGIKEIWTIGFTRSGVVLGTVTVITRGSSARIDKPLVEAFVRQAGVALDRRRAETEKDELEEQLFQAQKLDAIGTLAGGVAHDFNNILTGILGQSYILKRNFKPDSSLFESAEAIETMTLRASELTRQLLGFARKGKKREIAVDLHSVIDDVLVVLGHTFDKRITVTTRLTTEPSEVIGDPTQLQQIVLNLAVNARDAMSDGGKLAFATSVTRTDQMPHGRYVVLEVADTGEGIPADVRSRVFEPFFTSKEQGQGTGMGLAVVYGIVQNHGGWIELESDEGRGTKVVVALPAVDREGAQSVTMPSLPLEAGSGRILVVDDEQIVREVVERVLTSQGYEVICRENGRQAVEFYRDHGESIDLVILDLMMPVMNGTTCFRELRRLDPAVKVLLATGYALDEFGRRLVEDGLVGFVEKPFVPAQLAKAVVDALVEPESRL